MDHLKKMFGEDVVLPVKQDEPIEPTQDAPAENKAPVVKEPVEEIKKDTPTSPSVEIDDDAVLAALKKRGISVDTLDQLKAPVNPEEEAEKKENAKFLFAIEKGLVTKKEVEAHAADNANKTKLVFEDFKTKFKARDSDATDEQIEAEFNEVFDIGSEGVRHELGQDRINQLGDILLKNKYNKIYQLDSAYETHEREQVRIAEKRSSLAKKKDLYLKEVDEAIADNKKISVSFSDTESYSVDISDEDLSEVKELFKEDSFAETQAKFGLNKQQISQSMKMALIEKNLVNIVKKVAASYYEARAKGVNGIPSPITIKSDTPPVLSEVEVKVLKQMNLMPN